MGKGGTKEARGVFEEAGGAQRAPEDVPAMVDVRLPGRGNSNSHGARPVHLIITII